MAYLPGILPGKNKVDEADSLFLEQLRITDDPVRDIARDINALNELYQRRLAFLPINQSACNNDLEAITLGEWRTYVRYIEYMQYILGKAETVKLYMHWARLALDAEDALTCMLMAYAMATRRPHISDSGLLSYSRSGRPKPGWYSIFRSLEMVMGLRGFIHGWSYSLPDFSAFTQPTPLNLIWPIQWAADPDTDGESSFYYGSSGHGSGTDDDSGPPGVATGRPPATGLTSYSDTSSFLSSDGEIPCSRMDEFVGSRALGRCHVRRLIRMDNYLTKWHRERRERRAIRRARRWARSVYCEDRRNMDPRYNLIASRGIMLTSAMMKKKIEDRNRKHAEEVRPKRRVRKTQRACRRRVKKSQRGSYEEDGASTDDENIKSNWRWSNKSFHELYKQVIHSWARNFKSSANLPTGSNVNKTYDCWLTPVRWVRQSGAELVIYKIF